MPYRLLNGPSGTRHRSCPSTSYESRPKSAKNTYTFTPSVAGVGPAGPLRVSSFSTRGRGASCSHRIRPLRRSRPMVTRRSLRVPVRKIRSRVSAGEECPNGSAVFKFPRLAAISPTPMSDPRIVERNSAASITRQPRKAPIIASIFTSPKPIPSSWRMNLPPCSSHRHPDAFRPVRTMTGCA